MVHGTVPFAVPAEVAFDYLADPENRAEWQSSLRRVEDVVGEVAVGQTWTDVTKPGLRAAMRTTVLDRPTRWAESGTWRFVRADLELVLEPDGAGCRAAVRFRITGRGPMRLVGLALSAVSLPAVLADVRRAARLLADRA
ncbi:MAG: Polyketide cyclase / dehydrase and lipid transport [Nocardioidaceae bacterium]|nr:Polyketide cyclase / dehydrase and lipid transport [Nocardioidaceae bacterium]